MMTDAVKTRDALPASLPPRGLRRPTAAAYVGVSPTTFDQMIEDGLMPRPKRYRGCVIWDREALDRAFAELPDDGEEKKPPSNPWDLMSNV